MFRKLAEQFRNSLGIPFRWSLVVRLYDRHDVMIDEFAYLAPEDVVMRAIDVIGDEEQDKKFKALPIKTAVELIKIAEIIESRGVEGGVYDLFYADCVPMDSYPWDVVNEFE